MTRLFKSLWVCLAAFSSLYSDPALGVDAEEALASFVLHPDFQIELVASEPVIYDPVDLEFDERGRPFVMEMPGYPFPDVPGRVVLLKDLDDDGHYETRHVFAEGFPVADSLLPYAGGILVASPPDLVFLKDTDGDDVADYREVLATGFAVDNPQHNFNGLSHGLDNWVYGSNGGNGGTVRFPDGPGEPVAVRGDDFRFDLRGKRAERVGRSSGGFEITMDGWGRLYSTHNLKPISHLVFPGSYLAGLPTARSGSLTPIADDVVNGLVRIYPIGLQDTRVNHPEQSGYFSGSCGITFYGGGSFPEEFNGNVFVCDVVLNLIHRRKLAPDGTTIRATRGREGVEFLASSDRGFRPVNMTVAPDGSLWVLDMHRTVIEHPEWIPDEIEAEMDLDEGKEQGRIYRVSPRAGLGAGERPRFDEGDLTGAVGALGHRNKWWRDTAQRLLVEWENEEAVPQLEDVVRSSSNPLARLHALWTLEGLGKLSDDLLALALEDASDGVRENAVVVAEGRLTEAPELLDGVIRLANDTAPRVRLRTALALGGLDLETNGDVRAALLSMAQGDVGDAWARLALLPAFARRPVEFLEVLLAEADVRSEDVAALLGMLATITGEKAASDDVGALVEMASNSSRDESVWTSIFDGLAMGLERRRKAAGSVSLSRSARRGLNESIDDGSPALMRAGWRVATTLGLPRSAQQRDRLAQAQRAVRNESLSTAERLDAMRLLEFEDFDGHADVLYEFLGTRHPRELQGEAIRQLESGQGTRIAERLIELWRSLGPETRTQAGDILLYKRGNHELLVTALEKGDVALGELNLHLERRRVLLRSRAPGIGDRAKALFSDAGIVTRKAALEAMRPALGLKGDAAKGRLRFDELCTRCHRMGEEGGDLGPNLTEIYRKSGETLLHDILDPNAAVDTEFVSYTVEREDGDVVSGIVTEETDSAVVLRDGDGQRIEILRSDMVEMYSDGLSLMPEELEIGLDHQAMADLLAFLQEQK